MTPPSPLPFPPLPSSPEMFESAGERASPSHMVSILSRESFPRSEVLCFSREDFFNGDLVLSARLLDWCRIICFPCLVAMDYGLAAAMPYENNCQKCFSFMFMLSRIFVWGSLLFWLLPLTSMQVFDYQWSCNSECLPVEMFSYWKTCANQALSHNLPSFCLQITNGKVFPCVPGAGSLFRLHQNNVQQQTESVMRWGTEVFPAGRFLNSQGWNVCTAFVCPRPCLTASKTRQNWIWMLCECVSVWCFLLFQDLRTTTTWGLSPIQTLTPSSSVSTSAALRHSTVYWKRFVALCWLIYSRGDHQAFDKLSGSL